MQLNNAISASTMERLKWILIWITLVASTVRATAASEETRTLTLEECIRLALEDNFDVQIQRFNPQIAGYNLSASYSYYDPTFDLSAAYSFNSSPGGVIPGTPATFPSSETERESFDAAIRGVLPVPPELSLGGLRYELSGDITHQESTRGDFISDDFFSTAGIRLTQPLLRDFWIDLPRSQILVSKKNLKISEWAFRQQLIQSVTSVEQAYYNLIFAREDVGVQAKALELAERLLAENKKRVEVGVLAPLDEKQAEAQVATSRAGLIAAQRNLAVQENVLKNLLTDRYSTWHEVTIAPAETLVALPTTFDLNESWRKGLALRPDLHQLRLDLARRDIQLRYQHNQLFPALDIVGSYGHNGRNDAYGRVIGDLAEAENPRYSYGVVLSIPIGNRNARYRYRATKAEKEQADLVLKKLQQDILVQIDDAVTLAQSNFERVEATRQARLYAEAALEAEQKKLESGKSTSFFVLQLQRDLTAARSDEIRALADYNNALAQLAFMEGSTLERRSIRLEVK